METNLTLKGLITKLLSYPIEMGNDEVIIRNHKNELESIYEVSVAGLDGKPVIIIDGFIVE